MPACILLHEVVPWPRSTETMHCSPCGCAHHRDGGRATLDDKTSACALSADAPLRAVVIGAGLAGLATAKALCGLFDEVTLLERDDVAAAPASAEDATKDQVQSHEHGDGAKGQ